MFHDHKKFPLTTDPYSPYPREIEINGMTWIPLPGVRYPQGNNYFVMADKIASGEWDELSVYRQLILDGDLFFIIFFIMKVGPANHPFVIDSINEVMDADTNRTINLWAREHFKSTIITTAKNIWRILCNKESRIAIFSYAKGPAVKLLRPIKTLFEDSQLLKDCFPDVLYQNPATESPKWSEEVGLICKRDGFYKESTIEAHGLIEGMPVGSHFTHRTYDDCETEDLVHTPEIIEKTKRAYDLSQFLGSEGGTHEIVGTTYHWNGPLKYIESKAYEDGRKVYRVSKKPCLEVLGTDNEGKPIYGEPVLLSKESIDYWKTDKRSFNAQGLLDPSPTSDRKLNPNLLVMVDAKRLPARLYKFMLVDPAGDKAKRTDGRVADAWAFGVVGVEPYLDQLGASNIYVLDLQIAPMSSAEAMDAIVQMYCRNGRIEKIGVEKVAQTTFETHIANALRMKGRFVSVENDRIQILRPSGRSKEQRIESAIQWPLENSKLHVLETVEEESLSRLRSEMSQFPYWHDDGLDMLSYIFDLITSYRFGAYPEPDVQRNTEQDRWERAFRKRRDGARGRNSWQSV